MPRKNNIEKESIMKNRRMFVCLMAMLPWFNSSAVADDHRPELPFSIPFPNISKAGAKLSVDFICPKKHNPLIAIFAPRPVDPDKPLRGWTMYLEFRFKSGDFTDYKRVSKFAGSPSGVLGVPVQLKIKIISVDRPDGSIVYDKEVSVTRKVNSGGDGSINRVVDGILLDPGTYHIEIENINDISELENENVNFSIAYSRGK